MLVCHSAGGLAAREYIQSQDLWQTDGQHHVSRLVTLGTPHGGIYFNDFSGTIASYLKDGRIDLKADIIRDMRRQTIGNKDYFPYLLGGKESYNNFAKSYYNYDINCNGKIGENVLGLNAKAQPFVEATSIISGYSITSSTDGVVDAVDADIKNVYPNMDAETFKIVSGGLLPHISMTDNVKDLWTGMDEADYFSFAPTIKFDQQYWGVFSRQSPIDAPDTEARDYDDYFFKINKKSTMQIWLQYEMLSGQAVTVQIFKKSQLLSPIMQIALQKGQQFSSEFILPAGEYYLEFVYDADVLSSLKQYKFILFDNTTSSVATNDVQKENESFVYPNPASDFINIKAEEGSTELIKITDMQGREVLRTYQTQVDISALSTGLYIVQKGDKVEKLEKF
jgi:hypothetical protein